MTTRPTPKRWRPRFSVRTLVILVTLVCCYAACWGPTKRQGVEDVVYWIYRDFHFNFADDLEDPDAPYRDHYRWLAEANSAWSPAPFVVVIKGPVAFGVQIRRQYYFWFFGYVAKLPYERDVR